MSLERVDRRAADVALEIGPGGAPARDAQLASLWRDKTSVLVFLRHFG